MTNNPVKKACAAVTGSLKSNRTTDETNELPGITDNAVFNKNALPEDEKDTRSKSQKVKDRMKAVGHHVAHPRAAIQERATKQIIASEQPWLDNQEAANEELFEAHDAWEEAEANDYAHLPEEKRATKEHELRLRVTEVEEQRTELQVAWHMDRYVRRVRAVRRPLEHPRRELYQTDAEGKFANLNWVKYVGHLALYGFQSCSLHYIDPTNDVAYQRDVLLRRVERLIVASEAFQLWWMRVRHVYTWQDPWLTFKWLVLFFVLLKTNYFMSFYWLYLLYSVVTNFDGHHSRGWMKNSQGRAVKTEERASMISELIVRHGPDAWLEPFLDEFGPWMQIQLGDLADFFEICANYYDWRNPWSTACTCFTYFSLFLLSVIPSLDYSIRVVWLSCGLFFFLSRPIATNYPRFRHVVDPMRWMYWDSPTMTEFGFSYLRTHAQESLNRPVDPQAEVDPGVHIDPDDSGDDGDMFFDSLEGPHTAGGDLLPKHSGKTALAWPTKWSGRRGRLELTRTTARFVVAGNAAWERPLSDLLEIRKTNPTTGHKLKIGNKKQEALSLLWAPLSATFLGTTEVQPNPENMERGLIDEDFLYGMTVDARNEAFNSLIGLAASEAGVLWMELQAEQSWQARAH